jgi:hypothetical protein
MRSIHGRQKHREESLCSDVPDALLLRKLDEPYDGDVLSQKRPGQF